MELALLVKKKKKSNRLLQGQLLSLRHQSLYHLAQTYFFRLISLRCNFPRGLQAPGKLQFSPFAEGVAMLLVHSLSS